MLLISEGLTQCFGNWVPISVLLISLHVTLMSLAQESECSNHCTKKNKKLKDQKVLQSVLTLK